METERTQPPYGGPVLDSALTDTARAPVAPDQIGRRLVEIQGPHAGQVFLLTGPVTAIGRDPDSGVALVDDPTISRLHARIALEEGGHVLYDEGSSNGTYVNGVLLRTCPLTPGDVIQCGGTQLRYE